MKTAVFMRHGHAENGSDDHARRLSVEGREAAVAAARELALANFRPDVILASTATRASVTAELVARELGCERAIVERRDLYLADPEQYLAAIRELDDTVDVALLVAHNPGLEDLAQRLRQARRLPPAGYFQVESATASW